MRVERVAARLVERGPEVVADESAAGQAGLEVACRARDFREGSGGAARQIALQQHVHLCDRLLPAPYAVEQPLRQKDHVVRWRLRLRAGWRTDLLKERVGSREVDDTVDLHRRRPRVRPPDLHDVAGPRVEVGRRLLRKQHARRAARERSQLTGKRARVGGRQTENLPGAGLLRRCSCRRRETGRRAERDRHRAGDVRPVAHGRQDLCRVRARLRLYLPVDRCP